MTITKAVIAAGGWSTRFLPAVKAYAKHLIPIMEKAQLQLIVEELVGAGLTDICIIHRPGEHTIKQFFSPDPKLEEVLAKSGKLERIASLETLIKKAKFTFIPQSFRLPYGNGVPIIAAKKFISNEPFVYLWGDDLTIEDKPGHFLSQMIEIFNRYHPAGVTSAQKVSREQISALGAISFMDDTQYPHRIASIVEKPPADQAPSLYGQGARFIVTPHNFIPTLEQQHLSKGELWFTEAENTIATNGGVIMALPYQEYDANWMACGDPLNWLKANITIALRNPAYADSLRSFLKDLNLQS